jgi:hypothetical protein
VAYVHSAQHYYAGCARMMTRPQARHRIVRRDDAHHELEVAPAAIGSESGKWSRNQASASASQA